MKEDERNFIFTEIENKMNIKVRKVKKLYQATIDGGESINFHKKCDNIPNTLVLIKSEGQRRFGGFTPIPWKSETSEKWITDSKKLTFIFSLDNRKIYYLKDADYATYHYINSGPCFGGGRDIAIDGNPIKVKSLFTNQCNQYYDYKGNSKALSECGIGNKGKALDYEVFQVIFN